jgi:hypothetical protein
MAAVADLVEETSKPRTQSARPAFNTRGEEASDDLLTRI